MNQKRYYRHFNAIDDAINNLWCESALNIPHLIPLNILLLAKDDKRLLMVAIMHSI